MDKLLVLKNRFAKNSHRHKGTDWSKIEKIISNNPRFSRALELMEQTGGEPDVVKFSDGYYLCDCSVQSPSGRRSLCYDGQALSSRKNFKPQNSAVDLANHIQADLLDENQYRILQTYGQFDTKTSSWIKTPQNIRQLGGALFADCRYDTVFVYHNGAESYYSSRGFRCCLKVNE